LCLCSGSYRDKAIDIDVNAHSENLKEILTHSRGKMQVSAIVDEEKVATRFDGDVSLRDSILLAESKKCKRSLRERPGPK
jgi:hypothetical protein